MNSHGLSAAVRSEARGSRTPDSTLKGLNGLNVSHGFRLGSTPSGSGLSSDSNPGWRLSVAPSRAIHTWSPSGRRLKPTRRLSPATRFMDKRHP